MNAFALQWVEYIFYMVNTIRFEYFFFFYVRRFIFVESFKCEIDRDREAKIPTHSEENLVTGKHH